MAVRKRSQWLQGVLIAAYNFRGFVKYGVPEAKNDGHPDHHRLGALRSG
jgi:hypothetical protein